MDHHALMPTESCYEPRHTLPHGPTRSDTNAGRPTARGVRDASENGGGSTSRRPVAWPQVNDLVVDWRMAMTDLRSELLYGES